MRELLFPGVGKPRVYDFCLCFSAELRPPKMLKVLWSFKKTPGSSLTNMTALGDVTFGFIDSTPRQCRPSTLQHARVTGQNKPQTVTIPPGEL